MILNFQHNQSAHCENGVTSNLLKYYGINLSEPMVFGIGAGIFFSHMPFIKLNGIPVTSFRPLPGMIFKRVTKRLGLTVERVKFSNPETAMSELDKVLLSGTPVGMLVGVFNLSYFPDAYRFHFNAHNLVAFGKENNQYHISDPVMEKIEFLSTEDLKKVRYAKGTYPPKGRMYYIKYVPKNINIEKAIYAGIKNASKDMLTIPLPMFGVKGIDYLANKMKNWENKLGERKASHYLGQVIRMMEEIGTGGAGFRFIYAAFLQESADIINKPELKQLSSDMTQIGDKWREFSVNAARNCKGRGEKVTYSELSQMLKNIAESERILFTQLKQIIK